MEWQWEGEGMKLLLWEVGHFGGWAIGIWFVSYLLEANLSFAWSIVGRFMLFWAAMFWTFRAEYRERMNGQATNKTYWDLLAKGSGIVTASLTSGWWREVL